MIKDFIKKNIKWIALAFGLIISVIFGNIVMKNGNSGEVAIYDELSPIDRGQMSGFDLNTATSEQFMSIKGIGEV